MSTLRIVVLLTLVQLILAAKRVDVKTRLARGLSLQRAHKRSHEDTHPTSILGLQSGEGLEVIESEPTSSGTIKTKYVETYHGIRIQGEGIVIESDVQGALTGEIMGRLLEGLGEDHLNTEPSISENQAVGIALRDRGFTRDQVSLGDIVLEIDSEAISPEEYRTRLVYRLSYLVGNSKTLTRPFFVIDAHTGEVIDSWEGLETFSKFRYRSTRYHSAFDMVDVHGMGGNEKMGKHIYGRDEPALEVSEKCVLENEATLVSNWNFSFEMPEQPLSAYRPHIFDCEDGNHDSINGAFSPLNDAYAYINAIHDMFMTRYGHAPLNHRIVARVHFGEHFENAFWDGQIITFGDGGNSLYPLVTVDITAHEIGHGVTNHNSDLIYSGESGGLNEAFSDMMGESVVNFLRSDHDWVIGYEIYKDGDGMRFFEDPTRDGVSIGHYENYCPGMDVHHSSGIANKAFYLLAHMEGWDILKAFDVFFKANRLYWHENSNFADGACGAQQAAEDLGHSGEDVANAFRQVGIEPCVFEPTGFLGMHDLFGEETSEIIFTWEAPEYIEYLRFETFSKTYELEEDITLTVGTEEDIFTSEESGPIEVIEINEAEPGPYVVMVTGATDFAKVSLYVTTGDHYFEGSTDGSMSSIIVNHQFEVNADSMQAAEGLSVRLSCSEGGNQSFLVARYEHPVDVWSNLFDYQHEYLTKDKNLLQILLCHPSEGTWHITAASPHWEMCAITYQMQYAVVRDNPVSIRTT